MLGNLRFLNCFSWQVGGKPPPPSGVWAGAPENFRIFALLGLLRSAFRSLNIRWNREKGEEILTEKQRNYLFQHQLFSFQPGVISHKMKMPIDGSAAPASSFTLHQNSRKYVFIGSTSKVGQKISKVGHCPICHPPGYATESDARVILQTIRDVNPVA